MSRPAAPVIIPPAPVGLSPEIAALWPGLASDLLVVTGGAAVDFRALADLLRIEDRLRQVRAALDADGVTVLGSTGQIRPHPLLVTEATLARAVRDGYNALHLLNRSWTMKVGPDGRLTS
jgi:hypothetical protein